MRSKTSSTPAGNTPPKRARVAALETRQAKDYGVDIGTLRDRWHDQALEAGHARRNHAALGRTWLSPITANVEHRRDRHVAGCARADRTGHDVRSPDVLRGWCEQLPPVRPSRRSRHSPTAPSPTHASYRSKTATPTRNTRPPSSSRSNNGSSTARSTRSTPVRVSSPNRISAGRSTPGPNSRPNRSPPSPRSPPRATVSMSSSPPPGPARRSPSTPPPTRGAHGGYHVIGAALAATAAAQLQTQTGIPSDTIALRTLQLANGTLHLDRQHRARDRRSRDGIHPRARPSPRRRTRRRAKVVHGRRSPPTRRHRRRRSPQRARPPAPAHHPHREPPPTTRLGTRRPRRPARRPHRPTRSTATTPTTASSIADTAIDVRNHMAADWHAATLAGDHVIMLAERHYDVDDLNQRARRYLTRNGTLTGPALARRRPHLPGRRPCPVRAQRPSYRGPQRDHRHRHRHRS